MGGDTVLDVHFKDMDIWYPKIKKEDIVWLPRKFLGMNREERYLQCKRFTLYCQSLLNHVMAKICMALCFSSVLNFWQVKSYLESLLRRLVTHCSVCSRYSLEGSCIWF